MDIFNLLLALILVGASFYLSERAVTNIVNEKSRGHQQALAERDKIHRYVVTAYCEMVDDIEYMLAVYPPLSRKQSHRLLEIQHEALRIFTVDYPQYRHFYETIKAGLNRVIDRHYEGIPKDNDLLSKLSDVKMVHLTEFRDNVQAMMDGKYESDKFENW